MPATDCVISAILQDQCMTNMDLNVLHKLVEFVPTEEEKFKIQRNFYQFITRYLPLLQL